MFCKANTFHWGLISCLLGACNLLLDLLLLIVVLFGWCQKFLCLKWFAHARGSVLVHEVALVGFMHIFVPIYIYYAYSVHFAEVGCQQTVNKNSSIWKWPCSQAISSAGWIIAGNDHYSCSRHHYHLPWYTKFEQARIFIEVHVHHDSIEHVHTYYSKNLLFSIVASDITTLDLAAIFSVDLNRES